MIITLDQSRAISGRATASYKNYFLSIICVIQQFSNKMNIIHYLSISERILINKNIQSDSHYIFYIETTVIQARLFSCINSQEINIVIHTYNSSYSNN